MSQDTEQYRAGFEAWARGEGFILDRKEGGDYYMDETQIGFDSWIASKREASTEPSAEKCHFHTARDGFPCPNCPADLVAGALPDEAKAVIDAARKLVQCKGRYHTELNFKELAAAIQASTKAGSGQ